MRKKSLVTTLLFVSLIFLVGCSDEYNSQIDSTDNPLTNFQRYQDDCEGNKIIFDYPPVNLEKTELLLPLGLMTGDHVTPIDHQYFQNFANSQPNIEVYSPGKGVIRSTEYMTGSYEERGQLIEWADYSLEIQHTCTIASHYIHIDQLSEKILEQIPQNERYSRVNIPVEAGEIIGWYTKNVDYNLVDQDLILPGFISLESYEKEPWKIHVPPTLDYFNEKIKAKLIELTPRIVEPISGKLDHDVDGTLQGNWFLEGTNGYSGVDPDDYYNYYAGHLSVSPDYLDPNHIIVSFF